MDDESRGMQYIQGFAISSWALMAAPHHHKKTLNTNKMKSHMHTWMLDNNYLSMLLEQHPGARIYGML